MDRGARQATVHGEVSRVRQDLATKPPPNVKLYLKKKSKRGATDGAGGESGALGLGPELSTSQGSRGEEMVPCARIAGRSHRSSRRQTSWHHLRSAGGGGGGGMEEGGRGWFQAE